MAAARSWSPPCVMFPKSGPLINPISRVVILGRGQLSLKRTATLQMRSSSNFNNQVFEDRSEGIVCYRDENGEVICEGYDEGPRFQQKSSRTSSYHPRDAEIIDRLQLNWIQIVKGKEVYQGESGLTVQEDINCNGFNTFR